MQEKENGLKLIIIIIIIIIIINMKRNRGTSGQKHWYEHVPNQ